MFENLLTAMIDNKIRVYYKEHYNINVVDTPEYTFKPVHATYDSQVCDFKCMVETEAGGYEMVRGQITQDGIELIKRITMDYVVYMY